MHLYGILALDLNPDQVFFSRLKDNFVLILIKNSYYV